MMTNDVAAPAAPTQPIGDLTPEERTELDAALANLKPQHAAFVRHYVVCKTAAQAARLAGYSVKNIRVAAHRIVHLPKVAAAIAAFNAILARRGLFSFEQASAKLESLIEKSEKAEQYTAAVRAAELRAKLHGHLTDRVDMRHQGDVAFIFPERRARQVLDAE